jgi:Raf kinase inhibitor-like YbhB/YbcL family protein
MVQPGETMLRTNAETQATGTLWRLLALACAVLLLAACDSAPAATPRPAPAATTAPQSSGPPFALTSSAFAQGQPIPADYTCTGKGQSPPLAWTDPPTGTQRLALVVEDPDAPGGTFIHWVLTNIPGSARALAEAQPTTPTLPDGSRQGQNSAGSTGYTGPCPPSGLHHYIFHLYALDAALDLPDGATNDQFVKAADGHILGQVKLMGTYSK